MYAPPKNHKEWYEQEAEAVEEARARMDWRQHFDERQLKEIEFCRQYAEKYAHGTDGHNIRLIVAKLADLLDEGEHARPAED